MHWLVESAYLKKTIHPLTIDTLNPAVALGRDIFPGDDDGACLERCLTASLLPKDMWPKVYKPLNMIDSFVMMEGHKVIGFTGLRSYQDEPNQAWIHWIYLHPEHRGNGAGQSLLNFTISHAQTSGFEVLRLWTSAAPVYNPAMKRYKSNGFVRQDVDNYPTATDGWPFVIFSRSFKEGMPEAWKGYTSKGFIDDKPPSPQEIIEWQKMVGQIDAACKRNSRNVIGLEKLLTLDGQK